MHAVLSNLEFDDDTLVWAGRKVTDIIEEAGTTPLYIHDRQRMTDRVADLRDAVSSDLSLHYAMKANPHPEVVKHMLGLVDGLDVASGGEFATALSVGANPAETSFAGPGKRNEEITAVIREGATINVESEGELQRIQTIGALLGCTPKVAIRVNPSFELKSSGMKMGGKASQFGVDAERVPAMLSSIEEMGFYFRGFHVYAGSQNLRIEAIRESLEKTVDLIIDLARHTNMPVEVVNLGGGLGIPYFPNDLPLDLSSLRAPTERAVTSLKNALGEVEVVMEMGRFLVGEAGIYVCRVLDIKKSYGKLFAVCDGGLHHHLAASGNFGQVIRKNYPVVAIQRNAELKEISVVGPLCTPLDLLADRMMLSQLSVGSLVAVLQSGAYGKTASPEYFLSHPPCAEVVI